MPFGYRLKFINNNRKCKLSFRSRRTGNTVIQKDGIISLTNKTCSSKWGDFLDKRIKINPDTAILRIITHICQILFSYLESFLLTG
jgi:hypothetical protein